jgi:Peptidase M50B-like
MRWLFALIRNAIGVVLGFFALPWCLGLLLDTIRLHQHWPRFPAATATGFAFGIGFWFIRKPNLMNHTMLHEFSHYLLCKILRVRVSSFNATDGNGGGVQFDNTDPLRSTLIHIAPYTVPLLVGPALLARTYWSHGWTGAILSGVVAFLFLTHLQGLILNIRINFWGADADLPKVGRFLALVLIAGCLLLLTTAVVAVLWAGGAIQQGL